MKKEIFEIRAEVFNALAHPLRLKILEKLQVGACCVCKIIPYVRGEQSNVSHHLALLKRAGIVRSKKRGREVWYEVVDARIFEICDLVGKCVIDHLKKSEELLKTTREYQ